MKFLIIWNQTEQEEVADLEKFSRVYRQETQELLKTFQLTSEIGAEFNLNQLSYMYAPVIRRIE